MTAIPQRHLVYFADPMCSWCYGFGPTMTAIADHFGARLPVDIVMGGLRAGNTRPMRQKDKDYIREAWTQVGAASGQPFDFAFLDRAGFIYDTEPACRAVVTMRLLNPAIALAYKGRVSRAFYAEGRDTTNGSVLAEIAGESGVDAGMFEAEMASSEARNATMRDFLISQQAGVQGFPTLVAGERGGGDYALVTSGFRPLDGLIETLERWMQATAPVAGHA